MFFDLRNDYIDNDIVDFDDINDTKQEFINDAGDDDIEGVQDNNADENGFFIEEIDLDEIDGEEHIDDSDTDDEGNKVFDGEFVSISNKMKPETKIKKEKLLRDKKQVAEVNNKDKLKKGRGRKKNEAEPETNICEICGNIYSKRSLLNMHMRRHRAEKPFECE